MFSSGGSGSMFKSSSTGCGGFFTAALSGVVSVLTSFSATAVGCTFTSALATTSGVDGLGCGQTSINNPVTSPIAASTVAAIMP